MYRPQRPPPRPFGAQQPRPESASNLFSRVWAYSNAQHDAHIAQQTPQVHSSISGWREYDPGMPPTPTSIVPSTPSQRYASLVSAAEIMPPPPSPYPQPAPTPAPTERLANMIPWSSGSTSQIFKAVIKRPQLVQMYMNDELHTNAPDVENQFLAELRAYQTSGPHKHIASLLGCLDGIGMVLEQVDGDTLYERVLKRDVTGTRWEHAERSSKRLKIEWFNQIVEALVHVHQHGLSHGDLNSLNVLITHPTAHPPNIVKLIDFGRSTFYRPPDAPPNTPQSEIPHPPAHPFAAPEILRGGKFLDPRIYRKVPVDGRLSDAYSLGVLLWCLDEDRLVDLDQNAQRREEIVLFNAPDSEDDTGSVADSESSSDAGTPPTISPKARRNPVVDEGYFSGPNEPWSMINKPPGHKAFHKKRLFSRLIRGYMRRWEERTPVSLDQRMNVPDSDPIPRSPSPPGRSGRSMSALSNISMYLGD